MTTLQLRLQAQRGAFVLDVTIDARLAHGVPLIVRGKSGAGKSTLLKAILGAAPCQGHLRLGDDVIFDSARGIWPPTETRRMGYVPQQLALFSHWNVRDNVRAFSRATPSAIARELDRFDLGALASRSVASLSGGERQRVALARALCSQPRLLLLDEPLTALDASTRSRMRQQLREWLKEHGVPTLLVTHDDDDLIELGNTAILLVDGRTA